MDGSWGGMYVWERQIEEVKVVECSVVRELGSVIAVPSTGFLGGR